MRWATAAIALGVVLLVNRNQLAALTVGDQRPVLVQAFVTGVIIGGVYSLVSIGLTLIFGVLHVINFAHGAFMTLGMYASFVLVEHGGLDPYATLPIVMAVLFVLGLGVERGLLRRISNQPIEANLVLTLGLAILIENALRLAFSSTPRSVEVPYASGSLELGAFEVQLPFRIFGAVTTLTQALAFAGAGVLTGLLYLLLHRTRTGTAIRSVAENPTGATLVGIDVGRISMLTFGLGTACAGAAAVLVLPFVSLEPSTGVSFGITAFVVVVLGGLGSVTGAMIGGLLVGLSQELGAAVFPDQSKLLPVLVMFVLVLLLRPQGLLGKPIE